MTGSDFRLLRFLRFGTAALFVIVSLGGAKPDEAVRTIGVDALRNHVAVLSSDAFEGREAGTRGGKASAVYIVKELEKAGVRPGGDAGTWYQEFETEYRNILAVLPGSDPELSREVIVIGAHYDHVGYGNRRNSFGPTGQIHNGADDNASGVAGLIEIARTFAMLEPRPRRTLLFAFWDAEEKGLLGSEHWVQNPTVPLNSVRLKINADMIGRLRNETIELYGSRTAPGLRRLLAEQNRATDLVIDFNWDLKDDSDHFPFVRNKIPALMFHTMLHDDYHRPSDDADKVNYAGIETITEFVFRFAHASAMADALPAFRETALRENEKQKSRRLASPGSEPPRLGIAWDRERDRQGRVVITRVEPDSPAERAGLKPGDEIVRFGGTEIAETGSFRTMVMAAPREAEATIVRAGEPEPRSVRLELAGQPVRLGLTWTVDDAEPGVVVVTAVTRDSPADTAGIAPGDRLLAVDGRGFTNSRELRELLDETSNDCDLLIERRGQLRTVTPKLVIESQ